MQFRTVRSVLVAAAISVAFALPSFAADSPSGDEPWNSAPFSAQPQALLDAAARVPSEESDLVVLLEESRYTFDAQGRSTSTRRIVYRVVGDSAVDDWSTIDALWAPWYQEKPEIQARVIAKDGSIHTLDPKALSESAAPEESLEIFSDNRIIRAPLPAVAVGSVVEELITYKDKNPMYDAGTTDRFYFGRYVPVHQARLILESPSSLPLRVVNKSDVSQQKVAQEGGERLVFESGPIKAMDHVEWNLPFDVSSRPYVAFSTGRSWQEIATRYSEIVDKQIGSPQLQKTVKDAVGRSTDRKEVIDKILAEIQKNVRYAGVEIGESSIIPRNPVEVLSHKYGDCKDKATLLVAMLREAGISSHVVLLRAGEDLDVSPELPGMGQFNHAIVLVDGDHPMWIDPTDEFSRAGTLPMMDQGRLGLVASGKTTELLQTPMAESSANHIVEERTFVLSEEGKAAVTETTVATGADDSTSRRFYVETDKKKYHDALEAYAKGAYAAKALKKLDASDPHDLSKPFRLSLEITDAARGTTAGGEAAVAVFPISLLENLPYPLRQGIDDEDDQSDAAKAKAARNKRTHDFMFNVPYVREWRYTIIPPPGYLARTLPSNETTHIGTATMTKEFSTNAGGAIVATLTFDSGKRRISASEFTDMRKAIHDLNQGKPIFLGFDELGQSKLNTGDVGGALIEFRKLADLHPKEARHHVEIARALLAGGMGDGAREEIQRAIAIEPTYARGQQTLGLIMEHDLLGRPFRKGFDLPAALAAYRKAKELDPKDVGIRVEYAKLLEYGDDGTLFGPNNHVSDAIDELKAIATDLKENGFEGEQVLALAHAGRFAEMRDFAKTMHNPDQRDMARIIAAAALEGSAAAIREANALDQASRRKMLSNVSQVMVSLRQYPVAADLLAQATQGSAESSQSRSYLDTLRKTKHVEEMQIDDKEPKSVVLHFLIDSLSNNPDNKRLESYFAADERPLLETKDDDDNTRLSAGAVLRIVASKSDVPVQILGDLALTSMQFVQDGDDEHGYRIRMRMTPGLGFDHHDELYVIRENGKFVISAIGSEPGLIGWSALRFADQGKPEMARTWLNWAREEITAGSGDDPLSGAPFAALWTKSKQTATLDEIRLAAASLMVQKDLTARSLPILAAAREKATSDDVRQRIDATMAIAYSIANDYEKMLPITQRLHTAQPDSAFAFDMNETALTESDKGAEAIKLANERLAKLPKDDDAIRALGRVAMRDGKYDDCDKFFREVLDEKPSSGDYNNVAWNALFSGKNLDRALEDARQAVDLPGGGSASMHTLAALYAETGKSLEARDALLKSMDAAGREQPASHDWYVLGRIAENYGATEAAIAAYKRVEKQQNESLADSTFLLAQRRLKVITKKAS